MTIASEFRNACLAHAPLVSLVGTDGISEGDVDDNKPLPFVVFSVQADQRQAMMPDLLRGATITAECLHRKAALADQLAAAVEQAIANYDAATPTAHCTLISRSSVHNGELDEDGVILTIEWWTQGAL